MATRMRTPRLQRSCGIGNNQQLSSRGGELYVHLMTHQLTRYHATVQVHSINCMCSESDAEAVGALERLADSNVRRWEAELSSSDRQQAVVADAEAEGS
jgi:hypothetical protein